jgi:predicted DCC family thiol-disulfide oxidoreductase YuxK
MRFAPLDGPAARARLEAFPDVRGIDSLILIDGDRALVRSAAVLGVLRYLGGPWRLLLVARLIPREIRDSLYDVVAFWRKRVFGGYEACPVPPEGERGRFLG